MAFYSIEPILQELRIRKVLPFIKLNGVLVDIGCDSPPKLIERVSKDMYECIGIDEIEVVTKAKRVTLVKQEVNKKLKLADKSADTVTMLAVLEHLKFPFQNFRQLN